MMQDDGTLKRISTEQWAKEKLAAESGFATNNPVFAVGEVVEIKGRKFEIVGLGRKFLRLRGLSLPNPDI